MNSRIQQNGTLWLRDEKQAHERSDLIVSPKLRPHGGETEDAEMHQMIFCTEARNQPFAVIGKAGAELDALALEEERVGHAHQLEVVRHEDETMEVDASAIGPCDVVDDAEPPAIHSDCLRCSTQAPLPKPRRLSAGDLRGVEIENDGVSSPLWHHGADELGRVARHRHPSERGFRRNGPGRLGRPLGGETRLAIRLQSSRPRWHGV